MRRIACSAALLVTGVALAAAPLAAQGFVGAGVTTPMGDFGDGAKLGFAVNAGFRPYQSADKRMSIWAEGLFGQNNFKNNIDGKTTMMGGFGSLTYNLTAEASAVPYVIGSVGYLSSKVEVNGQKFDAEGALGFGGGLGVGLKKFYLEGRYLTSSKDGNTRAFVLWTAGYTF
jgi:hypothetical protein